VLLGSAAFLYWTVNSGQMVAEKMRLTNAADAAAYSAGVVHARALNFDAYTNRAIIANQVSIAQTISFVSWFDYFVDVYCNVGRLGGAVGLTGPITDNPIRWAGLVGATAAGALTQYASGGTGCPQLQLRADTVNEAASLAVTAFNGVSVALAASQRLMHVPLEAALFARSREAAQRAVDATGASMDAEVIPVSYDFANITKDNFVRRQQGGERSRLQAVILASRDSFTASRTWTLRNLPESALRRYRIERRGGTTMPDLESWEARDSMVFRWRRLRGLSWRNMSGTVGAGNVSASDNPSSRSAVALRSYTFGPTYAGLPETFDLSDRGTDPKRHRFGITVRVDKHVGDTLTSQHAAQAGPSGRLAVFGASGAPSHMAALARAEIVFDRPPRADKRTEYANLFNPFWQVRLTQPKNSDRLYAAARQGGVSLGAP
jgi:hypothetical protein